MAKIKVFLSIVLFLTVFLTSVFVGLSYIPDIEINKNKTAQELPYDYEEDFANGLPADRYEEGSASNTGYANITGSEGSYEFGHSVTTPYVDPNSTFFTSNGYLIGQDDGIIPVAENELLKTLFSAAPFSTVPNSGDHDLDCWEPSGTWDDWDYVLTGGIRQVASGYISCSAFEDGFTSGNPTELPQNWTVLEIYLGLRSNDLEETQQVFELYDSTEATKVSIDFSISSGNPILSVDYLTNSNTFSFLSNTLTPSTTDSPFDPYYSYAFKIKIVRNQDFYIEYQGSELTSWTTNEIVTETEDAQEITIAKYSADPTVTNLINYLYINYTQAEISGYALQTEGSTLTNESKVFIPLDMSEYLNYIENLDNVTVDSYSLNIPVSWFTNYSILGVGLLDESTGLLLSEAEALTDEEIQSYMAEALLTNITFNMTEYLASGVSATTTDGNTSLSGATNTIAYTDLFFLDEWLDQRVSSVYMFLVLYVLADNQSIGLSSLELDFDIEVSFDFYPSGWFQGKQSGATFDSVYYDLTYPNEFSMSNTTPLMVQGQFTLNRPTAGWDTTGTAKLGLGWDSLPYRCMSNYSVYQVYETDTADNYCSNFPYTNNYTGNGIIEGIHEHSIVVDYKYNSTPRYRYTVYLFGSNFSTAYSNIDADTTELTLYFALYFINSSATRLFYSDNSLNTDGSVTLEQTVNDYIYNQTIKRFAFAYSTSLTAGVIDLESLDSFSWSVDTDVNTTIYDNAATYILNDQEYLIAQGGGIFRGTTYLRFTLTSLLNLEALDYQYLRTELNPVDTFYVIQRITFNTIPKTGTNPTRVFYSIQFALYVWEDSQIQVLYPFNVRVDGTGNVYYYYESVQGFEYFSTNTILDAGKNYEFVFELDRIKDAFTFKINLAESTISTARLDSYISDNENEKPLFLINEPAETNHFGNATPVSRRGIALTNELGSNDLTGEMGVSLHSIYSSSGLLDEEYVCSGTTDQCEVKTLTEEILDTIFIEQSQFGAVADQYNDSIFETAELVYTKTIRDFRAVTGLIKIENDQLLNASIQNLAVKVGVTPILSSGSLGDEMLVYMQLYRSTTGASAHNGRIYATDSNEVEIIYGEMLWSGADGANGLPPAFGIDAGFGYYINPENHSQILLNVKAYDQETDRVRNNFIVGEFSENVLDVVVSIEYEHAGGTAVGSDEDTDFRTIYTIDSYREYKGASNPYFVPDVLDPSFNWQPAPPSGFFDQLFSPLRSFSFPNLFGGIGDFLGGLLDGIWDALGSVFDVIVDIGQAIWDVISTNIVGFVQLLLLGLLDFILDLFNIRDYFETLVSSFYFFLSILQLLALVGVFLCFSMPFIMGIAGPRESAPERILSSFKSIWFFDLTLGASFLGIRIPLPLIVVTTTWLIIIAETENITFLQNLIPF